MPQEQSDTVPREPVRVDLEIRYGDDELPLGALGGDLVEIDRGLRDGIRQSRREEPPKGREGWPSLRESAHVVRAETRSPLGVEATSYVIGVLGSLTATGIVAVIKKAMSSHMSSRPTDRPPLVVIIRVERDDKTAEDHLVYGDWDWPPKDQ